MIYCMLPPHSFIVEDELATRNASSCSCFPAEKVTANQAEPQGSTALLHLFFRSGTRCFLQSALPSPGPPPVSDVHYPGISPRWSSSTGEICGESGDRIHLTRAPR
ncbi:hypothetical protein IQ06DRAFT_267567 [Phaeosphaeriaceae sp. SRC1lsM3a]|nr:hypothetical protein IQ06DRAFT_267567 [Stagonospora sp. SRC1lsM3a]